MTYNKQTWSDGKAGATPVNAARLNNMETGIANARVDADYPVAFLYQNASTSLPVSWSTVPWHVADIDTHSGWSGTPSTKWTVPASQSGIYRIDAGVVTSTTASLTRILKNGVILTASWADQGGGGATTARLIRLVPGDYIEIQVYVGTATSTRATSNDGGASYFMIERIR